MNSLRKPRKGICNLSLLAVGLALVFARNSKADDEASPPKVTAKVWAIGDGRTGELLWGGNADEPSKSASTTKIMCALVVLELAAKEHAVLDEIVTFSQRAADTPGSSAKLEAGESLSVRECLFGLMLPSGNDAGIALAEHFNDRFEPAEVPEGKEPPPVHSRSNFIAEMNRQSAALGMTSTTYRLPYGDGGTNADRTTTPRDLLKLAHRAMQNETLRKYVSTKEHETEVRTPDGGTRTVRWTNTNRLLGSPEFDGIKTGTSAAAGACLVSRGTRNGEQLLVVVLGCESSDARYADSRSLYDWAWGRRQSRNGDTTD